MADHSPIVVIDTNVFLSAILFHGLPETIVKMAQRKEILSVSSQPILDEIAEKLSDKFAYPVQSVEFICGHIRSFTQLVQIHGRDFSLQDPDDHMVIETAIVGNARYIITGDKYLLALRKHAGISILSVRGFHSMITE